MSFSGNGAGRFQIRRIRNGSTAESVIFANGPSFQDFAEPTGQHSPNWNDNQEAADIADYAAGTTYAVDALVEFMDGIYRSLANGNVGNTPTVGQTDDNWEYEGPIGTPLLLKSQLLVNGSEIPLNQRPGTPGDRTASPVNVLITNQQWQVLVGGSYENVNTALAGFTVAAGTSDFVDTGANAYCLAISRNLDNAALFNPGALMDNTLYLRCVTSYNITGVLNASNALQTLTSNSFFVVRRNVLTESSMFARILLTDTGVNGSSSNIWNSGFRGDKVFQADLIIGANIANDDANFDVEYQWSDSDGTITNATNRTLTISRADVDTAETYFCTITDVHTGITYTTNSIEIRDFLDPIQFVEIGTATVDTGSNGTLTVVPYQNGAPMVGLTASNTTYSFEIRRQANATDMTGTRIAWLTTTAAGGLTAANRFAGTGTSSYVADTNPTLANGIAQTVHDTTITGATITITDTEMGAFGAFIDYDVEFDEVAN